MLKQYCFPKTQTLHALDSTTLSVIETFTPLSLPGSRARDELLKVWNSTILRNFPCSCIFWLDNCYPWIRFCISQHLENVGRWEYWQTGYSVADVHVLSGRMGVGSGTLGFGYSKVHPLLLDPVRASTCFSFILTPCTLKLCCHTWFQVQTGCTETPCELVFNF